MIDVYTDFAANVAAMPVVPGRKSRIESFAGEPPPRGAMTHSLGSSGTTFFKLSIRLTPAIAHELPSSRASFFGEQSVGAAAN